MSFRVRGTRSPSRRGPVPCRVRRRTTSRRSPWSRRAAPIRQRSADGIQGRRRHRRGRRGGGHGPPSARRGRPSASRRPGPGRARRARRRWGLARPGLGRPGSHGDTVPRTRASRPGPASALPRLVGRHGVERDPESPVPCPPGDEAHPRGDLLEPGRPDADDVEQQLIADVAGKDMLRGALPRRAGRTTPSPADRARPGPAVLAGHGLVAEVPTTYPRPGSSFVAEGFTSTPPPDSHKCSLDAVGRAGHRGRS